jgi:hypothetical protein
MTDGAVDTAPAAEVGLRRHLPGEPAGERAGYVERFLAQGPLREGIEPAIRDAIIAADTGREALRRAFSCYRAMPESAGQIAAETARSRLTVPTLAIGSHPVGDAPARRLAPVADDVTAHLLDRTGRIIPLRHPAALLDLLPPFLR